MPAGLPRAREGKSPTAVRTVEHAAAERDSSSIGERFSPMEASEIARGRLARLRRRHPREKKSPMTHLARLRLKFVRRPVAQSIPSLRYLHFPDTGGHLAV